MFDNNDADDSTDNDQTAADSLTDRVRRMFGQDVSEPDEGGEDETEAEDDPHTVPTATRSGVNESRWSLGSHTQAAGLDPDDIREQADRLAGVDDDLAEMFGEAAQMVKGRKVRGFECAVCGLNHGHSDDKHDIRDAFNVTAEFPNQMEFCPYCHCGANELAVIVEFIQFIPSQVFTDEDEFEAVTARDADGRLSEAVAVIQRQESSQDERASIENALDAAGYEVTDEAVEAFDKFYTRFTRVKDAADSAPIANETRQRINERREAMEEVAEDIERETDESEDDEDEVEGDTGTVVFQHGPKTRIETDNEDNSPVNAYESYTEVTNGAYRDLTSGVEVVVTEYETRAGETFASEVTLTE